MAMKKLILFLVLNIFFQYYCSAGNLLGKIASGDVVLSNTYSLEEVKELKIRAKNGELLAAKSLFSYYCIETDDMKACDYWMLKSALLGDEHMRCEVLRQNLEFRKFSSYKDEVKILLRKGACKIVYGNPGTSDGSKGDKRRRPDA